MTRKRGIVSNKYDPKSKKMVHDPETYKPSPWANHWRDDLIDFGTEGHCVIKKANEGKLTYIKQRVWGLGDVAVMENPFIVAFSGRNWRCPKDERELGKKILLRMSEMGLVPIHGNDKGTERTAGRALREGRGTQILVPNYGMIQFKNKYDKQMSMAVERGQVLVLSPFSVFEPWRIHNAEKRNILIAGIADAMIGVQVTDENSGGDLVKKMLYRGKPVYLTDSEGRDSYCVQDHQYFVKKGAKEFKINQLDYVIRQIKESMGYK